MISLCDLVHTGRLWGQVGIDHPDDADVPSEEYSDHSADRAGATGDGSPQAHRASGGPAETRGREEYDADVRATAPGAAPAKGWEAADPKGRPTAGEWDGAAERFRGMWAEYHRRWPPEKHPSGDRASDPRGTWCGEDDQFVDPGVDEELENGDEELEKWCEILVETERGKVSPKVRETESLDETRHLVGFEYRLKGSDRIKEKAAIAMEEKSRSPRDAISSIPDAIRYTFQYEEASYTRGVRADIVRMKEQGFELAKVKNLWSNDKYKGINSQWIEPESGQRFELQFHTRISFEAKQLTHGAYERLRTGRADEFEEMVLDAFQKKVSASVPIPPGAIDIPDYPERGRNAR